MVNTDLVVPLVVAAIGIVGTVISLVLGWWNDRRTKAAEKKQKDIDDSQKAIEDEQQRFRDFQAGNLKRFRELEDRKDDQKHDFNMADVEGEIKKQLASFMAELERKNKITDLVEKYTQPLLVAAYDLQQRLFELLEYPISRQHVEKDEGLEDLKIFTCYLLGQYLAYAYILRTQVGYLSFSKEEGLKRTREMMYMIEEELDRRRLNDGTQVGVWPAARVLISERMITPKGAKSEMLDGGLGVEVKGFDMFRTNWEQDFQKPFGAFCEWIDLELYSRRWRRDGANGSPLRCLQHLLVDLCVFLDQHHAYIPKDAALRRKCQASVLDCDCEDHRPDYDLDQALRKRQETRLGDAGLWSINGLRGDEDPSGFRQYYKESNKLISLDKCKAMTKKVDLRFVNEDGYIFEASGGEYDSDEDEYRAENEAENALTEEDREREIARLVEEGKHYQ